MTDMSISDGNTQDDDDFLSLDLTGVETPNFEPVPDGDYTLTIVDMKKKKADKNGNPGVSFTFQIDDTDKKVFSYFQLAGDNVKWMKLFLETLYGVELDGALSLSSSEIIGKQIGGRIVTKPRDDDADKMQNTVKSWYTV